MELSLPAAAAQPALCDTAPGVLPSEDGTVSGDASPRDPLAPGRRTLALRLAQRGRLRELRAERLARLRPEGAPAPRPRPASAQPVAAQPAAAQPASAQPAAAQPAMPQADLAARPASLPETGPAAAVLRPPVPLTPRKAAEEDAVAALEEFLRALTGGLGEAAPADWGLPSLAAPAPGPAAVLPFQRRDPEGVPESRPEAAADPAPAAAAMPAALPMAAAAPELPALTAPATIVETAIEAAPEIMPEIIAETAPETVPEIAPGAAPAAAVPGDGALTEAAAGAEAAAEPAPADPRPAAGLALLPGAGPGLLWALDRAGITDIADLAGVAPEALAERLGPIGRLIPAARWIEAARTPGLSAG